MKKIYVVGIDTEWRYCDDGPGGHDIVGVYPTEELAIASIIRRIEHYKTEALENPDEYDCAEFFSYNASEIKPGRCNRIEITPIRLEWADYEYIYYTEETIIENLSEEVYD